MIIIGMGDELSIIEFGNYRGIDGIKFDMVWLKIV
jgi:hypothetical protein